MHYSQYPQFLDIELSTADDGGFPVAITWSLPDGQLKSALIIPDDDWEPWERTNSNIDIQHLMDQGVSGPDVIREMNEDLDGQTVFVDGLDEDEQALELLYETYDDTLSFEVAPITQLYPQISFESLLSKRHEIASENQFNLELIEDKIRSLLFLHLQLKKKQNN